MLIPSCIGWVKLEKSPNLLHSNTLLLHYGIGNI
jgi:hypothetical protein